MDLVQEKLARLRSGNTIVFTNGVFDLIHVGHVVLLEAAKAMGDILVVGVNSDASVKSLNKGPNRPINCLADRVKVLEALRPVDYVIPFDESDPIRLIQGIRPHIHVKGGDYRVEDLPEYPVLNAMGAVVAIVPLVKGKSSTELIEAMARGKA